MSFVGQIIDLILHLDKHLAWMINSFGIWTYVLLFAIIFLETGLVVTPFLPGDSLVFAVGALSALGSFNFLLAYVLLVVAAILGDTVNYSIGHYLGPKAKKLDNRLIKRKHIERTEKFFEKYGGKTIILARFVPIVRTFAPFLAGVGTMSYPKFLTYNIVGGVLWISLFFLAGYFFGNIPAVQENFGFVLIGIIIVSFIPLLIEYVKYRREN